MIIWLNGAFGVGKTSAAEQLEVLVPDGRIFDPETVGYMLRASLSDAPVSDFQHWPAWRPLVVATALQLVRQTGQHLIAPQTVMQQSYWEEIRNGLRAHGLPTFHVLLDATDQVLLQRIEGVDEARQWRLDHLSEYRSNRSWMTAAADLVVDTGMQGPTQAARQIVDALPLDRRV